MENKLVIPLVIAGSLLVGSFAVTKIYELPQQARDIVWDKKLDGNENQRQNRIRRHFRELPQSLYVDECPINMQGRDITGFRNWMGGGIFVDAPPYSFVFKNEPSDYYKEVLGKEYHKYKQLTDRLNSELSDVLKSKGRLFFPRDWKSVAEGKESMLCPDMSSGSSTPNEYFAGGFPDKRNVYIIPLPRFDYVRLKRGDK